MGNRETLKDDDRMETEVVNSLTAVAKHFGVSQPAVSKWKAAGMPVREDGTYDLREITLWRATRAVNEADGLLPANCEELSGELTEIKEGLGRFRQLVESYKENRADIFAGVQSKLIKVAELLLDTIEVKQIVKMSVKDRIKSLKDIVSSVSGLFTNERLQQDLSTSNVSVIISQIREIKKRRKEREEAERQANASQ